ncbi:MAG TPA: hypothetical protein VKX28_23635 [Xanthobacteraceae bacterium]|jgi:hypothetical protein|nr:hypothetical protein [Xanthobacteraceae bacterium]
MCDAVRVCTDPPMKMHLLSGGRVRMRKSTYLLAADRSGIIELPHRCATPRLTCC